MNAGGRLNPIGLSTHVLDAVRGRPAHGVPVRWETRRPDRTWAFTADSVTDADGRVGAANWLVLGDPGLEAQLLPPGVGDHRLIFDTGTWFTAESLPAFYPEVVITFTVSATAGNTATDAHYHVPLLLSPYSYTTYRGS